eukprot:1195865-Prorocentrum_minimum.AAC.7
MGAGASLFGKGRKDEKDKETKRHRKGDKKSKKDKKDKKGKKGEKEIKEKPPVPERPKRRADPQRILRQDKVAAAQRALQPDIGSSPGLGVNVDPYASVKSNAAPSELSEADKQYWTSR